MNIKHHNPSTMFKSPAFSQAVSVEGATKMVYVGGQNGVTADGVMAKGLGAQTEQALKNVIEALKDAGATQEDVVKLTIYIVAGQDLNEGFAASRAVWTHATAITVLIVSGLANKDALVEVDAVAAVA